MFALTDFNASQATLVAPEPTTALIFSKPSAINTTLLLNYTWGRPLFQISTADAAAERTTISGVSLLESTRNPSVTAEDGRDDEGRAGEEQELLVTIRHRSLLPDTVTFSNRYRGRTLKLKEWLKEDILENGYSRWTIQTPIGNYVWRNDIKVRLALFPEASLTQPIAWAQLQTESTPFALILTRGTEIFREEIVASFIVLEQRMRMKEKMYFRAQGLSMRPV